MKLNEMKLEDLLYMNLHMLSKKLFNKIEYKVIKEKTYYEGKKVITDYKIKGPIYCVEMVPVYEVKYTKKISRNKYLQYIGTNKFVKEEVKEKSLTYKDEYNRILNSKIKDKEKALNNLYNDFYNFSNDFIKNLEKYEEFLNEDYLNRVRNTLRPTMEHYITKVLNKK